MLQRLFRDPFSGLSHLVGSLLGAIGLIYLVRVSPDGDGRSLVSVWVYGVSMVLLYASSATYHLLHVSDSVRLRLRQVDHAMVPVFIAGTYTPFCLLPLEGLVGTTVLIAVWSLAAFGLLKSLYWVHAPRWLTAGLFVIMGWIIVFAVYPLSLAVSAEVFWYMVGGGVSYTVGAVVYAKKWPDPWPPHFGFHELWHLFVLAGSALHFTSIAALIHP